MGELLKDQFAQLMRYRDADSNARQRILKSMADAIEDLPANVSDVKSALDSYNKLTLAARLIIFASELNTLESTTPTKIWNYPNSLAKPTLHKIELCPTRNGNYRFISQDRGITLDSKEHILERHFKSEYHKLYVTAATLYDEIPVDDFRNRIRKCIIEVETKDIEQFMPGYTLLRDNLLKHLFANQENSVTLKTLVENVMNTYMLNGSDSDQAFQKQIINTLKMQLQTETIKLHPIYQEAQRFIQKNTIKGTIQHVSIENGNHRLQTLDVHIVPYPLVDWFETTPKLRHRLESIESSQDLEGNKIVHFPLMGVLAQFKTVNPIDITALLASHMEYGNRNRALKLENLWDEANFEAARSALKAGFTQALQAEKFLEMERRKKLEDIVANLKELLINETEYDVRFRPLLNKLLITVDELKANHSVSINVLNDILNKTKLVIFEKSIDKKMSWEDYEAYAKEI